VKERDPKGTPKTLMPPTWVQKPNGGENPKGNPKRNQTTHCRAKSQGLPNLTGKKNDGKPKKQLKQAQ